MRACLGALLLLCLSACSLQENDDYRVGRECNENNGDRDCDPGERCLPHKWESQPTNFRCRNRASFVQVGDREPPLAFCDENLNFYCPGDLVCNPDRVREDAT